MPSLIPLIGPHQSSESSHRPHRVRAGLWPKQRSRAGQPALCKAQGAEESGFPGDRATAHVPGFRQSPRPDTPRPSRATPLGPRPRPAPPGPHPLASGRGRAPFCDLTETPRPGRPLPLPAETLTPGLLSPGRPSPLGHPSRGEAEHGGSASGSSLPDSRGSVGVYGRRRAHSLVGGQDRGQPGSRGRLYGERMPRYGFRG